jgi:RNA polymerase sigma-70 factor (ECF subfamily)
MDVNPKPASPESDQVALVQRLFIQHSPSLRGFVLACWRISLAVDDVMQEAFLVATRKANDFQPGSNFAAWITTIAKLEARTFARSEQRKTKVFSNEVLDVLCDSRPEPLHDRDLSLRHLKECLGRLAPQARQAVELRYQTGQKPAEIARHMRWTAEAVYVALSRARLLLRQCVEQKLAEEPT